MLCLFAQELSNTAIADEISLSEETVRNHVSSIAKKIDVSDRTHDAEEWD